MKQKLLLSLLSILNFGSYAQWTTSGNISNTNVGLVAINRNTGYSGNQLLIVNPHGAGAITLGEPNTGAGGYTSLSMSISALSNGYGFLQAVKSAGSAYGVISLNPQGGNVGIGTTNPGSFKLAVEGKIGAREVQVTLQSVWSDYVFENNYSPMPLTELEQFIEKHKHLPGIPNAANVKENGGFEVGTLSKQLLEKVEELTYPNDQVRVVDLEKIIKRTCSATARRFG